MTVRSGDNEFARGLGRERRAAAITASATPDHRLIAPNPTPSASPRPVWWANPSDATSSPRSMRTITSGTSPMNTSQKIVVYAGGRAFHRREDLHQRARTRASATVATAAGSIAIIASAAPPVTIHWPTQ